MFTFRKPNEEFFQKVDLLSDFALTSKPSSFDHPFPPTTGLTDLFIFVDTHQVYYEFVIGYLQSGINYQLFS